MAPDHAIWLLTERLSDSRLTWFERNEVAMFEVYSLLQLYIFLDLAQILYYNVPILGYDTKQKSPRVLTLTAVLRRW